MVSWMLEGGPFTWAVILLVLCGGFLTLVRVGLGRHVEFPGAGLYLAALAIGIGLVGTFQGWRLAFDAVASASADSKLELITAGVDLGWRPTTLAVICVAVLAPFNLIALARSRNRVTRVIKLLGWGGGVVSIGATITGLAIASWLAGEMVGIGSPVGGEAIASVVQAQTIQYGLLAGMFCSLSSALFGLCGGLLLFVAGVVSGLRLRKLEKEEEMEELE